MHASQPLPRVSDPARPPPPEALAARLLDAGGEALDDADLLQLVIAPFHPSARARQLAHALLDRFATPARVLAAPPGRLIAVPGLGEASVAAIKAAETLGIELARAALPDRILPVLDSYEKVIRYCRALSGHRPAEEFRLLFLDHRNRLIRDELHQRGTLAHTPAYPREICIRALETDAASLIAIHNHPSNDPTPSKADRDTTDRIAAALKTIGVALHDHIVVTPSATFSFRAHGLL